MPVRLDVNPCTPGKSPQQRIVHGVLAHAVLAARVCTNGIAGAIQRLWWQLAGRPTVDRRSRWVLVDAGRLRAGRSGAAGLLLAMLGLPWGLRERRPVPRELEDALRTLTD
jgi:hypothetical protein